MKREVEQEPNIRLYAQLPSSTWALCTRRKRSDLGVGRVAVVVVPLVAALLLQQVLAPAGHVSSLGAYDH
jgi:hypothetical protein